MQRQALAFENIANSVTTTIYLLGISIHITWHFLSKKR